MESSGKMCFKIVLKVTKNQGLTLSLEDAIFEKAQGGGVKLTTGSRFREKKLQSSSFQFRLLFREEYLYDF